MIGLDFEVQGEVTINISDHYHALSTARRAVLIMQTAHIIAKKLQLDRKMASAVPAFTDR